MKVMSAAYPVHEIMAIRSLVSLALLFVAIRLSGDSVRLNYDSARSLIFRGTLLFGSFSLFYLGLSEMPLTTNTALFFTSPLFITVFSIPLLGEEVGLRRWLGVLLGFVGVWIILRPGSSVYGFTSLYPIGAAILYALAQLMSRKMGARASAAVMTFFANVAYLFWATLVAILVMPFDASPSGSNSMRFLLSDWSMPLSITDAALLALTGVTGALGFWFSTQAYRISEANRIAPFEYVMLIWIPILSYLLWREIPDNMTILGATVIVISGLYVLKRDRKKSNQPIAYKGLSRTR